MDPWDADQLKSDETDILGDNLFASRRIHRLIREQLECIAEGNWEALYRDPADGRYWELTYPQSEYHGGGPPRLSVVAAAAALAKYRTKPA